MALKCPLCEKESVFSVPPESFLERTAALLGIAPFRCQFCSHRFPALRWGRRRPGHVVERREFRRIRAQLALAFTGDLVQGEGTIVDLSIGGCLMRSTLHVGVDDIVYLRITLPRQESRLELAAVVRSVGSRGIGCKFLRAAREDARLAEFLREQEAEAAGNNQA
nr:PilZ domain-containing protein [Nitrospirota bacterium]